MKERYEGIVVAAIVEKLSKRRITVRRLRQAVARGSRNGLGRGPNECEGMNLLSPTPYGVGHQVCTNLSGSGDLRLMER